MDSATRNSIRNIRGGNYGHDDVMRLINQYDVVIIERNNAEKREYDLLGTCNKLRLENENKL